MVPKLVPYYPKKLAQLLLYSMYSVLHVHVQYSNTEPQATHCSVVRKPTQEVFDMIIFLKITYVRKENKMTIM